MMSQPLILPLEVETGGLPGLRLAWSIYQVPAQPGRIVRAYLEKEQTNAHSGGKLSVQIKVPSNYICVP